ncbi:MAG: hypothetical protein AB7N76_36195 [Planctomycetota bacterium]
MTDEALRRGAREPGGAPEDEAAALRRGLRSGVLATRWVELMAYLGHAPAREALGAPAPAPAEPAAPDPATWCVGLWGWGREVAVRAALALAREVAPSWRHEDAGPDPVAAALEAGATWLAPASARRGRWAELTPADLRLQLEVLAGAALGAGFALRRREARTGELTPAGTSAVVAGRACLVAALPEEQARASLLGCAQGASALLAPERLREVVAAALLPHAWGLASTADGP